MDQGKVVEYDSPKKLLENPSGHFTSIVEATGPSKAAKLRKVG